MTGGDRGYFKDCAIGNADPTSEFYNFPCWKNCTYDAAANFYGYDEKDKPLRLDFSLANEAEITEFFSTKPNSEKVRFFSSVSCYFLILGCNKRWLYTCWQ